MIPYIPDHEYLKSLFPEDNKSVLWLHADHTFPMFCSMLILPAYSEKLVLGLSASIGKLSESLVRNIYHNILGICFIKCMYFFPRSNTHLQLCSTSYVRTMNMFQEFAEKF